MVRTVQENITGVRVIKALSKTEYEKKRFEQVNEELSSEERKAGNITSITNPSSTLILNLGLTFVVIVGAIRVNAGTGTAGVIIAFLSYFTIILNALFGHHSHFYALFQGRRFRQSNQPGDRCQLRNAHRSSRLHSNRCAYSI